MDYTVIYCEYDPFNLCKIYIPPSPNDSKYFQLCEYNYQGYIKLTLQLFPFTPANQEGICNHN